jgi:hypothetical protein
MRVRHGPESRLTDWTAVHLPPHGTSQRTVVLCRKFHEQIVLMLSVVNRLAIAAFARSKEIGISTPAHCPGLKADHASEPKSATGDIAIGHPHQPVDTAELILTAVASVVQKLREGGTVSRRSDSQRCRVSDDVGRA